MEYPTYSPFDRNELDELYHKMQSIGSALTGVESHIKNNFYNPEATACSIVSYNINPQKTYFATSALDISPQKLILDKHDWRSIFIMNPLPTNQIHRMIDLFEKYIGKVDRAEYVWAIKEQQVVLFIKFKYWYDNKFNRVLRSELIITQEKNKHTFTKEYINMSFDYGRYIFDIVLCKRKSNEEDDDANKTIVIADNEKIRRVIT